MLQGHTPVGGINPRDYGPLTVEATVRERFLIGSPDEIVTQLETLADAGITYIQGLFRYGDLPAELARRSLERFAAEVLPRLSGIAARPLVVPSPAEVTR
jgi:alkanesulfonate monooxygenase SsuD/methylene tetrahydromethanopterin reductase-like flavin-dependent oxidoreductase (luciferase family)